VVGQKYPMPGIAGGGSGAPNRLTLRYESDRALVVKHTADWVPLEAGDKINFASGGGGGWGDPLERPAARVLDDVLDEYVSFEGARRDYGVVLTGSLEELTLEVDEAATEDRRAEMRAAREAEPTV
jgi:N-methylhydantoinase B